MWHNGNESDWSLVGPFFHVIWIRLLRMYILWETERSSGPNQWIFIRLDKLLPISESVMIDRKWEATAIKRAKSFLLHWVFFFFFTVEQSPIAEYNVRLLLRPQLSCTVITHLVVGVTQRSIFLSSEMIRHRPLNLTLLLLPTCM